MSGFEHLRFALDSQTTAIDSSPLWRRRYVGMRRTLSLPRGRVSNVYCCDNMDYPGLALGVVGVLTSAGILLLHFL